jgi:hypothetical protein
MPKNIFVPVDAMTSPIVVPLGSDSRANAAEIVEGIAQAMLNRTSYIHARAVYRDRVNTMMAAAQMLFGAADDATVPLSFGGVPDGWRPAFDCTLDAGFPHATVYWGTSAGSRGLLALVINARWNPAGAGQWEQEAATKDSLALIFRFATNGLTIGRKLAGSSPWTTWDTGNLAADVANVNNVNAALGMTVGGSGDYAYSPARSMTTVMGCASAMVAGTALNGQGSLLTNGAAVGAIDFRFPPNWDVSSASIEIVHSQASATGATFSLRERTINFTTPAAAAETTLVTASGPSSTGYKKTTLSLTGLTLDPAAKEYRLNWVPGHASDTFEGWRVVGWKDNGPRSRLG